MGILKYGYPFYFSPRYTHPSLQGSFGGHSGRTDSRNPFMVSGAKGAVSNHPKIKANMISFLTHNLIWQESLWLVGILAMLALAGWFWFKPLFYLCLVAFIFCLYFFRNPERICPQALVDQNIIVCPADGKIVDISFDPANGFDGYAYKISIFLSPLNAHVNWIPVAGIIEKVQYVPGKFMMAFLPKSSLLNEHNDVVIRQSSGQTVLVRQIAGTIARRIVCWVQQDQSVTAGQKYGMIKFSSRVDLLLPASAKLDVQSGQSVYGGKTVIGRLG